MVSLADLFLDNVRCWCVTYFVGFVVVVNVAIVVVYLFVLFW